MKNIVANFLHAQYMRHANGSTPLDAQNHFKDGLPGTIKNLILRITQIEGQITATTTTEVIQELSISVPADGIGKTR